MKKISAVLLMLFFSGVTSAFATPFLSGTGADGSYTGTFYSGTVYDETDVSGLSEVWQSTYGGYTAAEYTGNYLGTFLGNDSKDLMKELIEYYLGDSYSITYEKVESTDTSDVNLTVSYDTDNQSGTWDTTASTPALSVDFYIVKAGSQFALYYVDPALQQGDWVTNHVPVGNNDNIPEISHLSASLVSSDTPPAPVPEPSTMILFGSGIAGLVAAGCKRRK